MIQITLVSVTRNDFNKFCKVDTLETTNIQESNIQEVDDSHEDVYVVTMMNGVEYTVEPDASLVPAVG